MFFKKCKQKNYLYLIFLIFNFLKFKGKEGFEPFTLDLQSKCSTNLQLYPIKKIIVMYNNFYI